MVSDRWREVASGADSSRLVCCHLSSLLDGLACLRLSFLSGLSSPTALPSLVVFVLAAAFAERERLLGPCEGHLQI